MLAGVTWECDCPSLSLFTRATSTAASISWMAEPSLAPVRSKEPASEHTPCAAPLI